jgi:uncharacterized protein DUF5994
MLTTTQRHTATSPAPAPKPRLRLQPDLSARTLLDGGWWPRSADPAAELPGLILAIDQRHGPITQIMAGWDASRPSRLRADSPAGSRVVRLGWYETKPAGLLTATATAGRTDLLTVPPHTSEPAARAAMDQAAQAGNRTRPRSAGRHHHSRHPGPPARPHPEQDRTRQHPGEHLGMGRRTGQRQIPGIRYVPCDLAGT